MGEVTSYTKDGIDEFILSAEVVGTDLILTKGNGEEITIPLPEGGGGSGQQLQEFFTSGVLTVSAGTGRFRPPFAINILGVSATIDTPPTGASVIVDMNKNGTSIFTNQANRPTILAGSNGTAAEVTNMDIIAVAAGDYITVDIDQIGSSTPGSNLGVLLRYEEA